MAVVIAKILLVEHFKGYGRYQLRSDKLILADRRVEAGHNAFSYRKTN
ncbi:MAG: hypothetical protein ACJA0Z_002859 [Halioglobus sp.]|jgi:hypothetical protein